MDKALDDIVKSSRTGRRGSGRRPNRSTRAKVLGPTNTTAAKTAAKKAAIVAQSPARVILEQQTSKVIVSGLPSDVEEQQLKELFTMTIGPIRNIQRHFNPQGKWNGSATILFTRKGDGNKAYEQFNNRLIDDKRPMKIELIFDPANLPPPSLISRVAPKAAPGVGGAAMEGVQRTGGRPRRGRGPRTKNARPQKTVEDLDAEMEDYTSASNAPAGAVATAA